MPESRCRVCREPCMRRVVDELLSWRGVPVPLGGSRFRTVKLAEIHRHLNDSRGAGDRVTYTSLWNHARRHYGVGRALARADTQFQKQVQTALGAH